MISIATLSISTLSMDISSHPCSLFMQYLRHVRPNGIPVHHALTSDKSILVQSPSWRTNVLSTILRIKKSVLISSQSQWTSNASAVVTGWNGGDFLVGLLSTFSPQRASERQICLQLRLVELSSMFSARAPQMSSIDNSSNSVHVCAWQHFAFFFACPN